jgi:hypothetical protein
MLHNGLIVVDLIQDGDEAVVAALDAGDGRLLELLPAVLWNRYYFLRFRFRLLKSYGSGSHF